MKIHSNKLLFHDLIFASRKFPATTAGRDTTQPATEAHDGSVYSPVLFPESTTISAQGGLINSIPGNRSGSFLNTLIVRQELLLHKGLIRSWRRVAGVTLL